MTGNKTRFTTSFPILVVVAAIFGFGPRFLSTAVPPPPPSEITPPPPQKPRADELRPQAPPIFEVDDTEADDSPVPEEESVDSPPARLPPRPVAERAIEDFATKGSATLPPGLLVEADSISTLEPGGIRILDVRYREKYWQRHIPGAVHVNIDEWVKAFTASPSSPAWEQRIGALGINLDTPVVICDDGSGKDAASLWSILRYWGVKDVRVLNGGWPAWLFTGAQQDDAETRVSPRSVKLEPNSARVITRAELQALVKAGSEQIVGAFASENSSGAPQTRSGIPSMKYLAWTDVVDWRKSAFRSAADITLLFRSAGIDPARPIVVCGDSLEEAATLACTLEAVGAKQVRIYFRGWDR